MTALDTPDIDLAAAGWVSRPFRPLDGSELTPLPTSLLPDSIYDLVTATQTAMEVPAEMAFACCLGVASAVCQTRWEVEVKPGWVVPTSLHIAVLADPGEMKTPTLKPILKPIREWEAGDRARVEEANQANATKATIVAGQIKKMEADAIKDGDYSDATIAQIDELKADLPPIETPRRLLTSDVTPERLQRLMAENEGAISVITDEGGSFLKAVSGRYSNGNASPDPILRGWDNSDVAVDRSNRNDVSLDHGRVSLMLMLQKHLAREVLGNDEFSGRGLVDRFLWLIPSNTRRGRRTFDGEPVPDHVLSAWSRRINTLLQWSPAGVSERGTTAHVIRMTPAAREQHHRYVLAIERQLLDMDEGDPRLGYRQKWRGQVVRIAGVLHCLAMAAGDHAPHEKPIGVEGMQEAIAIAGVLLDQSDAALGMVGQDPNIERAMRIVKRLKDADGPTTTADLWRSMRRSKKLFEDKSQFDHAVETLFRRGYLATLEEGKKTHITLNAYVD